MGLADPASAVDFQIFTNILQDFDPLPPGGFSLLSRRKPGNKKKIIIVNLHLRCNDDDDKIVSPQ